MAANQDGATLSELAKQFQINPMTATAHLKRQGIKLRQRGLTQTQIEEAVHLYVNGWSLTKIGERFGIYPHSVRYRLRQAGVPLRPRPGWSKQSYKCPLPKHMFAGRMEVMKRIDVVKRGNQWVGETGKAQQVVSKAPTKEAAVKKTAAVAKKDPNPVSVKIHNLDGKIQEERTYPRSADPRKSPG
jgi:transposase-like protein